MSDRNVSVYFRTPPIPLDDTDLDTLKPRQWLNDAVIDVCLYTHAVGRSDDGIQLHVVSSTFYKKLNEAFKRPLYCNVPQYINRDLQTINYLPVHAWYPDFFGREFHLCPIRVDGNHWLLAVICVGDVTSLNDEIVKPADGGTCCDKSAILVFDSLSNGDSQRSCCAQLRAFLNCEWYFHCKRARGMRDRVFDETNCPVIRMDVEQQSNQFDCGLYVIRAAEVFMQRVADVKKFFTADAYDVRELASMFAVDINIAGTDYRERLRGKLNSTST